MKEKLKQEAKSALKAKDKIRLETVRGLLAAIQYEEMQKEAENLCSEDVTAVLKVELKKRREQLEFAEQAKRQELIDKSKAEIGVIESFLPKQMGRDEIEKIISGLKQENPALDLGAAMKLLKERYSGQYDGRIASEVAKQLLS